MPFGGAHGSKPTGSADMASLTTGDLQLVALAQQASLCHSLNGVPESLRKGPVGRVNVRDTTSSIARASGMARAR
jgi:hypothetical protein